MLTIIDIGTRPIGIPGFFFLPRNKVHFYTVVVVEDEEVLEEVLEEVEVDVLVANVSESTTQLAVVPLVAVFKNSLEYPE